MDSEIQNTSNKMDITDIQKIVELHNTRTSQFQEIIQEEKNSLTYHAIFQYLINSDYKAKSEKLVKFSEEIDQNRESVRETQARYDHFCAELEKLMEKKISQVSGIRYVNQYLQHYFAVNHLELAEYNNGTSFKVVRDRQPAHHLSEGECSLISFCYFMAKLKELENLEETIVWIDDPISSLDSNHIFYIFSLIENELAKPIVVPNRAKKYQYKQLFISTHNMEFLKYLHRLSQPILKKDQIIQACNHSPQCIKKVDSNECSYFILERTVDKSIIKQMPKYMRNFSTEYNYLFSKIFKIANTSVGDLNEDYVYNFGNNLRKFLEAHLYFKFPTNKISEDEKLRKFMSDPKLATICQRITNEMSHLEECFDRGITVLDIPEAQKLAQVVLDLLSASDHEQYDALVKSVA